MEKWDLVDNSGQLLNIIWDRSRHNEIPEGMYHPCVEVWVKVGDKLLITRRHPDKSEPLKFDLPGGAVVAGESALLGALRELSEEVGIFVTGDRLIKLGEMINGKVFATSYMLILDNLPELTLQPTEVVGYMLVSKDELESMTDQITRGTLRRYPLYKNRIFEKVADSNSFI